MEMESKESNKDGCSQGLEAELVEERQLPLEIILDEIMCRLPVMSLARFRSVCKIFNSVISCDPRFAILQLKNSLAIRTCFDRQRVLLWDLQDCSVAFFLERKSSGEFSIERINTCPMKGDESYQVVASCDGLVCILNIMTNSIIFWNPLTGETKRVSDPPEGISLSMSYHWCSYGLGYDSSSDDYKLVLIKNDLSEIVEPQWNGLSPKPTVSGVYSLRTNSWRWIQDFPNQMMCFHEPWVFINGSLYWIVCDIIGGHYKVVSFCLKRERYSLFSVPAFDIRSWTFYNGIQVIGKPLAAYCKSEADGSFHLLFLNPDDCCESWTKHTVTLPNHRCAFFNPICLLEDVGEILFRGSAGELDVYYLSDNTFRYSHILGLPESFEVISFYESLISPNTYTGSKISKISGMENKEGTVMENLA